MARRTSPVFYVIFGLMGIGIVAWFLQNPAMRIIPILIFGAVFVAYKFPSLLGRRSAVPRYGSPLRQKPKKRATTFRVIPGSKSDDDDDVPRVH